jgi:hypothetical protein
MSEDDRRKRLKALKERAMKAKGGAAATVAAAPEEPEQPAEPVSEMDTTIEDAASHGRGTANLDLCLHSNVGCIVSMLTSCLPCVCRHWKERPRRSRSAGRGARAREGST